MVGAGSWFLGARAFRGLYFNIVRESLLGRAAPQHAKGIHCNRGTSAQRAKSAPEGPNYEGPEYIPTRKAKNPMKTIGWAWAVGLPSGILLFLFAKREVDKNRLKQLKVRQRIKESIEEEHKRGGFRKRGSDSSSKDVTPAES